MWRSTPRSLRAPRTKVTKLEIIVGRTRTLQKCPMKASVGKCDERKTRSKARPAHGQLYSGRPTARSRHDNNAGTTARSAPSVYYGMSIRTTGHDPERAWVAIG